MASRRVATTAVNWTEFARKIPASQKASFAAMKQKYDDYMRAVNSLPEAAPKIAFDGYKAKIPIAGMVDDFQKKYEGLQIPYPKENVSGSFDSQLAAKKQEYVKFCADSEAKITEAKGELDKWQNMRPIVDMTMEECLVMAPELNLVRDFRRKTFYPHDQSYEEWLAEAKELTKHAHDDH